MKLSEIEEGKIIHRALKGFRDNRIIRETFARKKGNRIAAIEKCYDDDGTIRHKSMHRLIIVPFEQANYVVALNGDGCYGVKRPGTCTADIETGFRAIDCEPIQVTWTPKNIKVWVKK